MAESGLAGTNDQQAAHVDGLGMERFQSGDHQVLTFATHVAAYDDRRIWSTKLEQKIVRSDATKICAACSISSLATPLCSTISSHETACSAETNVSKPSV